MDFSWAQEQHALYNHIVDRTQNIKVLDSHAPFWSRAHWRACGELGLLGLSVPERYGGSGYLALTTACAMEAFGYGCEDTGLVFSVAAHLFACCMPIAEYGSTHVKDTYLPGLCSGELIGANAISEQDAGSDVFALKTRAVANGDLYVLNGHKSYVSNGPVADLFVIYASTQPAHGYLGISGFVVEKHTPGLTLSEPLNKMGLTSTPACQLTLHECCIPATQRLGKEGQGALIFKRSMQWERACLFALYLGVMDRQLTRTIDYAKGRRQFKRAIGKNQAIAHRVANMKLRLEAARLLLYQACWQLERGDDAQLAISLAKLAVSEAAIQGGLDAIHIHGAAGFDGDAGIERMLRDAIPSAIFSGTSEMQYDIIASELGL